MRKAFGLILWGIAAVVVIAVVIGALSHTSSGSSGTAAGPPSSEPSAVPSSAPVAEASSAPCTTKACIIADAKDTLVGGVAKNESVMTKLACVRSTVRHPVSGVWTVHCTADYSNGMVAKGVANILLNSNQVTWSPTDIISYGSS